MFEKHIYRTCYVTNKICFSLLCLPLFFLNLQLLSLFISLSALRSLKRYTVCSQPLLLLSFISYTLISPDSFRISPQCCPSSPLSKMVWGQPAHVSSSPARACGLEIPSFHRFKLHVSWLKMSVSMHAEQTQCKDVIFEHVIRCVHIVGSRQGNTQQAGKLLIIINTLKWLTGKFHSTVLNLGSPSAVMQSSLVF